MGNNLIECTCISDAAASGTRTILLQANNIVPIAETIQHPHNCKEYVLNDAVDYLNLHQFALQVLQYPDSPIPMSLNTTTSNKQFEFELHLYK